MGLSGSVKRIVTGIGRPVLRVTGIDPALVKAALRKPPAVRGAPPVRRWPWPRRRHFGKEERNAVVQLMNREIRQGDAIIYGGVEEKAYCESFAKFLGGGYADAVNSGTNAVYVALRALDLEPGSEVIVPPITDPGGTMPVAMMHCIPIAADSAPGSLNTSVDEIARVLTERTKAIMVTHVGGCPVDMDPILALANKHGIPVVEDCAQAHGSTYKGRIVGTFGSIAAFSTMYGKQHATGAQGGVVFTRSSLLFARARQIADRGKPYGVYGVSGNLVASLNFNQDEISMAIGRVQLQKLPAAIKARRAFASAVADGLRSIEGVSLIGDPANGENSYWFMVLRFDRTKLHCDPGQFAAALSEEGIGGVSPGYPFYPTEQPWHRDAVVFGTSGLPWSALPGAPAPCKFQLTNAHDVNREIVRVDVHESLGPREARDLVAAVSKTARYYRIT